MRKLTLNVPEFCHDIKSSEHCLYCKGKICNIFDKILEVERSQGNVSKILPCEDCVKQSKKSVGRKKVTK